MLALPNTDEYSAPPLDESGPEQGRPGATKNPISFKNLEIEGRPEAEVADMANILQIFVAIFKLVGIIRSLGWGDPAGNPAPWRYWKLFNNQMKTDVWALVGVVVTTIQTQQVTH